MKTALRLLFSLSVSAVLLYLAFRGVDFQALRIAMREVQLGFVLAFVGCVLAVQAFRIFRWGFLVRSFTELNTGALLKISNVGLMLVLLLPLRLGEFARPYLLRKETGTPFTTGIGTVVVERVFDGLLITLIFFASCRWIAGDYAVPPVLQLASTAAFALFLSSGILLLIAVRHHDLFRRLLRRWFGGWAPGLTERVLSLLASFVIGISSMRSARTWVAFSSLTLAYWGTNALGYYWVTQAMHLELPFVTGLILISVVALGIMIPAGPGHLGTFQAALTLGLSVFGVGVTQAAAYGLLVYPLTVLVVVGCGLPYLLFGRRVSVQSVIEESTQIEDGETPEISATSEEVVSGLRGRVSGS